MTAPDKKPTPRKKAVARGKPKNAKAKSDAPSSPKSKGRPSVYSEATAAEICARLADGETMNQICRDNHMPARSTINGWVIENRKGFSERYARARDLCLAVWADEIIEIGDDGINDWMRREAKAGGAESLVPNAEHVNRSRLRVESRKWLLSKLNPDRFGEKVKQEITGANGAPLHPAVDLSAFEEIARQIAERI